jgi:cobalt-zinc-cadmium efflux system membrane fusion protein
VKFPARLISINPSYNEGSSVELHCDFEQFSSKLIAGTFMKAEIKTGKQTVDVLPNSAIVDFKSKKYAFVEVAKNTYKMIEVTILKEFEAFTTISIPNDYKNATFVKTGSFSLLLKLKNTGE